MQLFSQVDLQLFTLCVGVCEVKWVRVCIQLFFHRKNFVHSNTESQMYLHDACLPSVLNNLAWILHFRHHVVQGSERAINPIRC